MEKNWRLLKNGERRRDPFFLRAKIISLVRDFFRHENFLEVETPNLVKIPGMEPYLNPIKVDLSLGEKKQKAYLTTSPEYAMKKILAAGFPKIFQICKSFRGGEIDDKTHNLEFTILEWYRARADYRDIMRDTEQLIAYIARNLRGEVHANSKIPKAIRYGADASQKSKLQIKYQDQTIDLTPPWPRLTVKDAFGKYAKIDLDKALTREAIAGVARTKGYTTNRSDRFDDIFFKIFLSEIEPRLGVNQPTILMDWPTQMAALSKKKGVDPRYAERFEVYVAGLELGNAFSELTDWKEQKARLAAERKLRKNLGKDIYEIDEDFLCALKSLPPSGGIAMGVDRIVMLFADAKSIEEIMFFPTKEIFNT